MCCVCVERTSIDHNTQQLLGLTSVVVKAEQVQQAGHQAARLRIAQPDALDVAVHGVLQPHGGRVAVASDAVVRVLLLLQLLLQVKLAIAVQAPADPRIRALLPEAQRRAEGGVRAVRVPAVQVLQEGTFEPPDLSLVVRLEHVMENGEQQEEDVRSRVYLSAILAYLMQADSLSRDGDGVEYCRQPTGSCCQLVLTVIAAATQLKTETHDFSLVHLGARHANSFIPHLALRPFPRPYPCPRTWTVILLLQPPSFRTWK